MGSPRAVTRRSSRSVATGSAAIIRARRLTAAPKRPSGNGSGDGSDDLGDRERRHFPKVQAHALV